ncbi:MAG: hypothetical protein Q9196_005780 [Gyalolechia fulgens]
MSREQCYQPNSQSSTNGPREAGTNQLQNDHSLSGPSTLTKPSPLGPFKHNFESLRALHHNLPHAGDNNPRLPTHADFPSSIYLQLVPERTRKNVAAVEHVVILLHTLGGSESSLKDLALDLNEEHPETVFVLLRGLNAVPASNNGYHWADTAGECESGYLDASETILTDVIKASLISNCGFSPRDILIIGHGQGGMAAMAVAALWNDVELGGVVSIGGCLPSYLQSDPTIHIKTPVLAMGGSLGHLSSDRVLDSIKARFFCVDTCILDGVHDNVPDTKEATKPLLDFLAHRLRREEWVKQAVLSFDGGGIRGYGSLLVIQELMNKIGDEERRLDELEGKKGKTKSSFAPGAYKPIIPDPATNPRFEASDTEGLRNSSLFLPCHYFDYAVGTSTGGLISIMLSRLRMTVDDCISEYKTLGQKIFGHPRPLAFGAILWHKFDYRVLERVLRSAVTRHSEASEEYVAEFPSDKELCRTLVTAYADRAKTDAPYLFRTYYTPMPNADQRKTMSTARNHGPPPKLPIWKIGRATSAAPKYFPPIKIFKCVGDSSQDYVRFKDGGFGCNNPSVEAYRDIVYKHGGLSKKTMGPFISFGTGITPLELFAKKPGNVRNALANMHAAHKLPSRTLQAHDTMTHLSRHDGEDIFPYYRFDGGERLGEVELDEWKTHRFTRLTGKSAEAGHITLDKMDVAIAVYLRSDEVQSDLNECAKLLVARRRLRARDASRWDRYASASFYECSYPGCEKFRIKTAQLFKEHVKKMHPSALIDQSLEVAVEQSRRCWIYRTAFPTTTKLEAPKAHGGSEGLVKSVFQRSHSSSATSVSELLATNTSPS